MMKQADITQMLGQLQDRAGDAGSALKQWYGGLNPDARSAIVRGLAGAAVGGATTHMLTPREKGKSKALSPALLGALLGGGAAAGIPAGLKMMGNGINFGGEKRPLALRALEAPGDAAFNHPLTTALPIAAGFRAKDAIGNLHHAMTTRAGTGAAADTGGAVADTAAPFFKRLREALIDNGYWKGMRNGNYERISAQALQRNPGVTGIRGGRARLAAIPLALLLGLAGDKYLKGQW